MDTATLETLLAPISPEKPAGIDLRDASDRSGVLARLEADYAELIAASQRRADEPKPTGGRPVSWGDLARQCQQVLQNQSKDLQVATILAQAWTRLGQAPGLTAGFQLLDHLLTRFWNEVHPRPLPGTADPETALGRRVRWLRPLNSSPEWRDAIGAITLGRSKEGATLTVHGFRLAQHVRDARRRGAEDEATGLEKAGAMAPDLWRKAFRGQDAAGFAKATGQLQACCAAFAQLQVTAVGKFGGHAPDWTGLAGLLADLEQECMVENATPPAAGPTTGPATAPSGEARAPGQLDSRADAVTALREVAAFLRRTEPHSPVPFLLDRCVHWLGLGFEDLMNDLVRDDTTKRTVRELLGIKPPSN